MIQRTVEEQQRQLYWHRRRQAELLAPRVLLRETDELMFWLEECLVQRVRIVPGWLVPRLVALLSKADPALTSRLGRERRPAHVMELLFEAQERLMEQSVRARRPARIIPLFRNRR
ncbi:MAG TPA: hypothetical protein VF134_00745 [Candidatus Dormibacteraeota bacterium]